MSQSIAACREERDVQKHVCFCSWWTVECANQRLYNARCLMSCLWCIHRPSERSGEDVDIILTRLREVKAFHRFPPPLLLQICASAFYECLEKGITRTSTRSDTHAVVFGGWLYWDGSVQLYNRDDLMMWQWSCRGSLWCLHTKGPTWFGYIYHLFICPWRQYTFMVTHFLKFIFIYFSKFTFH